MVNQKARDASIQPGCPVKPYQKGIQPFGWEGDICDQAIHADNVPALKFVVDHGIITKDSKTFYNTSIRHLCVDKGAVKCNEFLAAQGFPA